MWKGFVLADRPKQSLPAFTLALESLTAATDCTLHTTSLATVLLPSNGHLHCAFSASGLGIFVLHFYSCADIQWFKADSEGSHLAELMVNKLEMGHKILQFRLLQVQVACWFKKAFNVQVERQQASWWVVVLIWILHKIHCVIVLAPAFLCYEETQIVVHSQCCQQATQFIDKAVSDHCVSLGRSCSQLAQMPFAEGIVLDC